MKKARKILNKPLSEQESVYLVYGEEDYLLEKFLQNYIDEFVSDEIKGFNLTHLEDDSSDFARQLKNKASTVPVGAERRFVIAHCKNYFVQKNTEDDILISLLSNFPESTILLIAVYGDIDRRIKINREVKKAGQIINLSAPRKGQLDEWIKKQFIRRNKEVDRKSISFLEYMFNSNLLQLNSEIEKITTCFHEQEKLTYQDIRNIISRDRLLKDDIIFSFVDAFSERNKGKAIQILNEMLSAGEPPLRILAMINRQLRLLISAKELKSEGQTYRQAAKKLGEHPYPIQKCYRFCDNFSFSELEKFLSRALEANRALVTRKYEKNRLALEIMLLEI